MTANKLAYGSPTTITITLGTLAFQAARQSDAVDNSSNLFPDVAVVVVIKTPSGTLATPNLINVYAAGSIDGSTWPGYGSGQPDGVTGSDSAITLDNPTNLPKIGQWTMDVNSGTFVSPPMSVASAFNGVMPQHWSIIIENQTGAALLTGSSASFAGIYTTNG